MRSLSVALLCIKTRIDGDERRRKHSFSKEILKEIWNTERSAKGVGCIRIAKIMRKHPIADQSDDAAEQNASCYG